MSPLLGVRVPPQKTNMAKSTTSKGSYATAKGCPSAESVMKAPKKKSR